jgi:3-phosphoshikimate 1-carboxyvinyltransferase
MTLSYLETQNIPYEAVADYSWFRIPGGASYRPMDGPVPGDFSSAAFPAAAAAVTGGPVTLFGLEKGDIQGDKAFFDILAQMGCKVLWDRGPSSAPEIPRNGAGDFPDPAGEQRVRVSRSGPLRGGEFDLNATPDLLPVLAALACYAQGETALVNAAHARIKETDRIAVMAAELKKLGADIEERPDGLRIRGKAGGLRGARVDSHGDHRAAMALAVAALGISPVPGGGPAGKGSWRPVEIDGAEIAAVTYPGFLELLGADMI